ncbi:oleosin-B4-like [Patiria miniata]|uniref:Uncharacterized protein n=1 Tax=Patiria miniata TaxID=46514 RepID=A0A913ZP56_PATMI|nr:oleosin-B4-like [Patiria miniata]
MVQLSVNVDGQKGDQVKKSPDSVEVPIPAKPYAPVAVKRGRCCSKTVVCISVISVVILLVVGATLLGVFLSRHKSWEDCFNWDDTHQDEGSHSGGGSHGDGPHHGGGSHGPHGNWTHGGHGGHGGGHDGDHGGHGHGGGDDGDHGGHGHGGGDDGNNGGHGGEEDGGGHRYPGNEGDHFPDGRP